MKFNFDKIKKVATKTGLFVGITAASISPLKSTGVENNKNIKKIDESSMNIKENHFKMNDNIHYTVVQKNLNLENQSTEINNEDMKIVENIINLENKFKELSKGETEIMEGSISLISGGELLNIIESNNGSIYTSPLDNRYITELVLNKIFNKNTNLKIISKDYTVMKDSQSLHDENWVNYSDGGYKKHLIPEYYFVINQNQINNDIIFQIKIIHSKKEKIETVEIIKKLPSVNNMQLQEFVEGRLVDDISSAINSKLEELKL